MVARATQAATATGSRGPQAVPPSKPAAAGPTTNPRLAACPIRPKAACRRAGVAAVRSATSALATEMLPPVAPSRARARNTSSSGTVRVAPAISASPSAGSESASRKRSHAISVPSWLATSTRLRPARSDQRPRTGAPTSWHAE